MRKAIEISFLVSREDDSTTFAVTTRRHIDGCLWDRSETVYEGQHTIDAINTLSKVLQQSVHEIDKP